MRAHSDRMQEVEQPQAGVSIHPRSLLTLAALAAATFIVMTTETLPVGLLAPMADAFGVGAGQVGTLVTSYAAVVMVGALPLSILVSRFPAIWVMLAVLGALVISVTLTASSADLRVAVAARLLGGAAHAVFYSCSFALATSIVPEHRSGRAVAIVGSGNALALALGVPAATALGLWLGWRVPYWVAAGVLVTVMAVLLATYRSGLQQTLGPAVTMRSLLTATASWPLARVGVSIVLVMGAHFTVYTYISPILDAVGFGRDAISVVLAAYGLAGVVGLVIAGRLVDARPRMLLRMTVAVTLLAVTMLFGFRGSIVGAAVATTVWGLAIGAAPVLWQLIAVRAAPAAASMGPAVVNSAFNVGIALGALTGGHLLDVIEPTFLTIPSIGVLAIALTLVLTSRWLPADPRPRASERS
jgi:predicted MFS family arabinose efflux permease